MVERIGGVTPRTVGAKLAGLLVVFSLVAAGRHR